MTLDIFLFYLTTGRLLIWLLQNSGLLKPFWQLHPLLVELSQCDLCLGFWVYLFFALFLPPSFSIYGWWLEVVILAALSTFMAHLLRLGWQAKFSTMVIEK